MKENLTLARQLNEKTLAMNEALVLGSLRQHELTEQAERLNEQLRTEIIERKRTEHARSQLAAIVESSEDAIIAKNLRGVVMSWNGGAQRLFGYQAEDVIGRSLGSFIRDEDSSQELDILERLSRGERIKSYETVRVSRNGRAIEVFVTVSPIRNETGAIIGVSKIFHDITETRRAEEQSRLQLTVLQSSIDAIVVTGRDGIVQWVNPAFTGLTGYSPAEAIGQNPRFYSSGKQDLAFYKKMWSTVLAGQAWRGEIINQRKDGSLYPEELTITPVTNAHGQITHFVAIKHDITGRKQLETILAGRREELERLVVERTTKLNEIIGELEHFSYAIVHDMRAPLRAMQSYAAMLEEEFTQCLPPQGLEYSHRIQRAANRMDRLITDSLKYSKAVGEELPLTQVDIPPLLRDIIESYPNLMAPRAEITIKLGELKVQGNEAALIQCFSNLLGNAVKFSRPGIQPQILVRAEPSLLNENSTRIWIEDNGIGIPSDLQVRIFDLFQRGTNQQEGTGIGLAIVRKAVQRMGGLAGVESEPGKGSRFWLELPRAQASPPL